VDSWKADIETRLYLRGERVSFLTGDPARNEVVEGVLIGLAPDGSIMLELTNPSRQERFASGELILEDRVNGNTEPFA
jgi:hypothetical protein